MNFWPWRGLVVCPGTNVRRSSGPSTTQRSDAGLPVTGGQSGAPAGGAPLRRLADRVGHQARRGDGPDVVSPARLSLVRVRLGVLGPRVAAMRPVWARMGKSGDMPPARNVLFITLDQWRGDCLSALGHPVVADADTRPSGRQGRAVRQPLGQCGAVRALASLSLHRHLPAPQPLAPQRHPARRPVHERGTRGPHPGLRPRPVRVHRHLGRSAHRGARRHEAVQLRGHPAGLPRSGRGPLGAGEPGVGAMARRAGRRRPARTRTSCTSR